MNKILNLLIFGCRDYTILKLQNYAHFAHSLHDAQYLLRSLRQTIMKISNKDNFFFIVQSFKLPLHYLLNIVVTYWNMTCI